MTISTNIIKKRPKPAEGENQQEQAEPDPNCYDNDLVNGMFIPCVQSHFRTLLYVKVYFNGIEKEEIYDNRLMDTLNLPEDLYNN